MTESCRKTLKKLAGGDDGSRAATDVLQELLLQIVFALLMIFIIAYFIFVSETKKVDEAQLIELNRQKLILALEKTVENKRVRYGLNALMVQGTDGRRVFDAGAHVDGGRLNLAPAVKKAFSSGSAAAFADYGEIQKLKREWYGEVVKLSEVESLSDDEIGWLENEIAERVEAVRLDARGVQRSLASRLQAALVEDPGELNSIGDANALAEAIKRKSLDMVRQEISGEVLP